MAFSSGSTVVVAPKLKPPKSPSLPKIYGAKTLNTTKLPQVRAAKVRDGFPQEVSMQNKRVGGLTRGLIKNYQETPARFLPRSRGLKPGGALKEMAMAKKVKIGV